MLNRITAMLGGTARRTEARAGARPRHDKKLAAAALMVEAARMDGHFDEAEKRVIEEIVGRHFGLDPDETEALLAAATHKTPAVKRWLKKHPRFHIHFTPTSASWLNMVERFFAEITRKRIRRGVFKSVAELEQAIYDYLAIHNHNPVPFVWTATATAILEKTARAKQTLETVRAGTKC